MVMDRLHPVGNELLWSASLSMIFLYLYLLIGEAGTIRNETTYPIHGKYPLNLNNTKKRMNQNFDTPSYVLFSAFKFRTAYMYPNHRRISLRLATIINSNRKPMPTISAYSINLSDGLRPVMIS